MSWLFGPLPRQFRHFGGVMRRVLAGATGAALGVATALAWAPVAHADTSITTCTEAALKAAIAAGGTATYGVDCHIAFSRTITIRSSIDVESGGHSVSFNDGNGRSMRMFVIKGGTVTFGGLSLGARWVYGTMGAPGSAGGAAMGGTLSISAGATVNLNGDFRRPSRGR